MKRSISLSHWGAFEADVENGRLVATRPLPGSGADADMIGALPAMVYSKLRVACPCVRKGWLQRREKSAGGDRGCDEMIPMEWDEVLPLVAGEMNRVKQNYGHSALFAGSYGWSSAGRFHHARTQLRRFFGAMGGFTDQTGNYSWGAAEIILKRVLGSADAVASAATSWQTIAAHTDVFVAFGGLNPKNWRVTSGGAGFHHMPEHVQAARQAGTRFVVISPVADDIPPGIDALCIAPRPGTDTAIMLGLCHEMLRRGRADFTFLRGYCDGVEEFLTYLGQGKTLAWAARIADVPLKELVQLADLIETGTVMLSAAWSLQRAQHGEQPYWALIALAAILGQIGLPGAGFTFGYGSLNAVGHGARKGLVPSMPVIENPLNLQIPVARLSDMLERPGETITFNGRHVTYPDIKLVYWAGGNPFHHAQDLFRLQRLWSRPQTIIVHEQFWTATAQRADIVLPATTSLERADIGGSSRDPHVFSMPKLIEPVAQARNDFDILASLAELLDCAERYTESRNAEQWQRHLWLQTQHKASVQGISAPDFDSLRQMSVWRVPPPDVPEVLLSQYREDPDQNALATSSGRIVLGARPQDTEDDTISAHPCWLEPDEWLGNATDSQLALLSRQPSQYLHSQHGGTVLSKRPEVFMNPDDASKRALKNEQRVLIKSARGACLATLVVSSECRTGVVAMTTGPWFVGGQGALDKGGNPNALTADIPASGFSQACAAQSCLVTVEAITDANV